MLNRNRETANTGRLAWRDLKRPARSIAAVAAIFGLVASTLGCRARQPTPPPGLNEVQLAGWQGYVDLNCAACHGEAREGKRSGPVLTGLAEYWSVDQLVSYLTDPDAMVKSNPRLAYKAEKFAIGMPKASGKSPGYAGKARAEKLRAIAEYLLVDIDKPGD
jgi:mono/diheme cytochrome c family protein